MTPGSVWKVKGMKGLRFLEGVYKVGCNYRNWNRGATFNHKTGWFVQNPLPELNFDLKVLYYLVDLQCSEHGLIRASFLSTHKLVSVTMYETFWDRSFRLAKRTTEPKKVERLLFDKYDVEELKKKLEME